MSAAASATSIAVAPSVVEQKGLIPISIMIAAGIGFLIFICVLIFNGIPSARTETYTYRNTKVLTSLIPILIITVLFSIGSAFWIYTSKSPNRILPLIITPFLSFTISILALYFSMFQIKIQTS